MPAPNPNAAHVAQVRTALNPSNQTATERVEVLAQAIIEELASATPAERQALTDFVQECQGRLGLETAS